jgi:hypothetical protein
MINSKTLTEASDKIAEAMKQSQLAYQFCPGSYTAMTMDACLAAAKALDKLVAELAFTRSAEWLRKFPKIMSDDGDNV